MAPTAAAGACAQARARRRETCDPLKDKLEAGKPASRLLEPTDLDPFGLEGGDVGDGALLEGETMPDVGLPVRDPA